MRAMRLLLVCAAVAVALVALAASGSVVAAAPPVEAAGQTQMVQAVLVERLASGDQPDAGLDIDLAEIAAEQAPPRAPHAPVKAPGAPKKQSPAPKANAPKSAAGSKTGGKGAPSTPVKLTASTPDDVAKWAEHKARNRKKYATPEKEAAAFEKFKANRRLIEARNARAAATSKLNKKPFSSKGALATKSPQQFKKFLRTKKPVRGSSKVAQPPRAPAPKGPAPKPNSKSKTRFVQLRRRQTPQPTRGSGKAVGKSGKRAGKSGSKATETAGTVGKSGSKATTAGGGVGKSGAKATEAGGGVGKSGAKATDAGGNAGKSGAKATDAGGNAAKSGAKATDATGMIVSPTAQAEGEYLKAFTGALYMNPLDKTMEERLCRVVHTVWTKRYAFTEWQRTLTFGSTLGASRPGRSASYSVAQRPIEFCTTLRAVFNMDNIQILQKAFNALVAAPSNTPFLNPIISLDVAPRDQEQCGSCWAHVALGSYEVALRKQGIRTPPLSVQQVLDCARTKESQGCAGGTPMDAVNWLSRNFVATEAAYPYTGADGQCRPAASGPKKAFAWVMAVPSCEQGLCASQFQYEMDLLFKVQTDGPFVAYVDATNWQYYDKGIFPIDQCKNDADAPNHVIELMGYGHENGTPYWIVKNSWGPTWGENGYIKLAMGVNSCGIANYVGQAALFAL